MKTISVIIGLFLFVSISVFSTENSVKLPPHDLNSNTSLTSALKNRKSCRSYSDKGISTQVLSDLLWSAFGVNRTNGKRTAPTAMNTQNITIYVAMKSGVYIYDAIDNTLKQYLKDDIRNQIGYQEFVSIVPVDLIFVADLSKSKSSEKDKIFYSAMNTGYISQNVYLFCSANNLGTVAVGWMKKDKLAKILKLNKNQRIILAQPVGYPKL